MNYDDLYNAFPHHDYFYEVVGLSMAQALETCARVTGAPAHVINFGGGMVLATQHALGDGITWLRAIPGNPAPAEPEVTPDPDPTDPA